MKIEDIAKICHQANKALCETYGDLTQQDWDAAEQWQRDSAVKGVRFALEFGDADPSAQHDAWVADKTAAGWVYGEVKDPVAKTHPCIVPYDQLPIEQQAKDYLFKGVVGALVPLFFAKAQARRAVEAQ